MAINNPAFRDPAFKQGGGAATQAMTAQQLEELYNRPVSEQHIQTPNLVEPEGGAMTYEDTVVKTVLNFALLLVGAGVGWFTFGVAPWLWIAAGLVGFVLALVNIFKKEPAPALILAYAAVQGVFLGGISMMYEQQFDGIVFQAVLATVAVVGVTLALFASGKIRASKKATKVFLIAMVGYLVFSLLNVVLMMFGAVSNPWGLRGMEIFGIPLGLVIGVFVVIMGAYSLVLDFDFIQRGVQNKAPKKFAWTAAFGIMVTVIWLYLEILRMIAIARSN